MGRPRGDPAAPIVGRVASVEVIPAFLASPGDLADERADAREVVQQMNTMLGAPLGMRIELYGWEDQPPGYGRPQGQINPRVDDAELFIGLLWRRWGTPSGDGFTSGFEEEYRRAIARRDGGDVQPHIWLFFKDVEAGQLSDPGAELQKVLDFKVEVQAKREVLYKSFSSKNDWREQLLSLLANFLAERVQSRTTQDRSSPPATQEAAAPVAATEEPTETDPSLAQLVEALGSAANQIHEQNKSRPDNVTAARVLLAAFNWVSRGNTTSVIETHEANLLYRLRSQVEPTPNERLQLMRSMVTGDDLRPGWAWFTELPERRAPFLLAYLAVNDPNDAVRRAAVETLGDASLLEGALPDGVNPDEWEPDAFLAAVANDRAPLVQAAAMRLMGRAATDAAIERLRTATALPQTRTAATQGLVDALLYRDPGEALRLVATEDPYSLPAAREAKLISHAKDYDTESVNALRESRWPSIRKLGLRIADARDELTEPDTTEALDDSSADVRVLAIDLRLKHGWRVDDEMLKKAPNAMRLATRTLLGGHDADRMVALRRMSTEQELRFDLNWYLGQTPPYYEALGRDHFDSFGDQVRRDLDDGFQTFREESRAALEERFAGLDLTDLLQESDYTEAAFTAAALEVLAEHGGPEDRERVLRHLNDSNWQLRATALHALTRVGEAPDAAHAVREATGTDDGTADSRREAAEIAIALSPASANELLEATDPGVVRVAVAALSAEADGIESLNTLLNHQADDVRVAAVAKLASALGNDQLEAMLDAYLQQERYFYNVVVWLDRLVFAQEPFRTRFAKELGVGET